MHERGDDAGAAAPDGVAERDGATVDVQALVIKMQVVVAGQHLHGEGFVQLHQLERLQALAGFFQQLLDRRYRSQPHATRIAAHSNPIDHSRQRHEAPLLEFLFTHHQQGGGAVGDLAGVAGADAAVFFEDRGQLRQLLRRDVGAKSFVLLHQAGAFLFPHFHRDDFVAEATILPGAGGALVAAVGVAVLLVAGDVVLGGQDFGGFAHDHLGKRAEKAVAVHGVGQALMAHLQAPARAFKEVRQAAHGFRAAHQ